MNAPLKKENLNVRIAPDELDLIRRGAEASGKSVSAFVVEAARANAEKAILDQRFFYLDAAAFDEVEAMLSNPAKVVPELKKLFDTPVKWATSKR